MDAFEFYNPVRVIFGVGKSKEVGQSVARLSKRVLIVSYKECAFMEKLLKNIERQLSENGVEYCTLFEITANPLLSQVRKGVDLCRKEKLDCVVAVGGGSVMDAAKLIAAGTLYPHDLWKMIISRHDREISIPPEKALPILMVPTLPATSSEMNCGAVVTNDDTIEKSYLFNECIYPTVSIIDPALTCGLPAYQTACGAADAISHVLESYFNAGSDDTPLQDRLQESVILTIMELAPKVLKDPENLELRASIQWASVLAWNGWIQAGVSPNAPMHQLGHVISAHFNVTHGATLSIVMPAWMKYVYKERLDRYMQFAERIFGINSAGRSKEAVAEEAIERFEYFLKQIGVPTRLSDVDIGVDAVEAMTGDVAKIGFNENGVLSGRPEVGYDDIKSVFEGAL